MLRLVIFASAILFGTVEAAIPKSLHRAVTVADWVDAPYVLQYKTAQELIKMQWRRTGRGLLPEKALQRRAAALVRAIENEADVASDNYVGEVLDRIWAELQAT
jgi:hypothetical protein